MTTSRAKFLEGSMRRVMLYNLVAEALNCDRRVRKALLKAFILAFSSRNKLIAAGLAIVKPTCTAANGVTRICAAKRESTP